MGEDAHVGSQWAIYFDTFLEDRKKMKPCWQKTEHRKQKDEREKSFFFAKP